MTLFEVCSTPTIISIRYKSHEAVTLPEDTIVPMFPKNGGKACSAEDIHPSVYRIQRKPVQWVDIA